MQKKVLISLIIVNLFVLALVVMVVNYQQAINSQFDILNDNQIRIYNRDGFTTAEMKELEQSAGVDEVVFDNRNIFPQYSIDFPNNNYLSVTGTSLEEDNQYQQQLDYLAGTYLTDVYQTIISQSLADYLIANTSATDYQQLIGSELVNGLEIVGVYPDLQTTEVLTSEQTWAPNQDGTGFSQQGKTWIENGFMLFNRGQAPEFDQAIASYNMQVANEYDIDGRYVYNYNDSDKTNDNDSPYVNYEQSVANGAEHLIDPETKAYGPKFNNFGFINASDRDQVVATLSAEFPEAAIVTNDTKITDFQSQSTSIIIFLSVVLIFELFIFVPIFKYSKKH